MSNPGHSSMCVMLSHFNHVWLFATLWTAACQTPLSMGFSRQEYWSGLPCPPPGYLPDLGIKPTSLLFPALAGRSFTTRATWEALATPALTPNSEKFASSPGELLTICDIPPKTLNYWPSSSQIQEPRRWITQLKKHRKNARDFLLLRTRRAMTSGPPRGKWGAYGGSLILINVPLTAASLIKYSQMFPAQIRLPFPQGIAFPKCHRTELPLQILFWLVFLLTEIKLLEIRDCVFWFHTKDMKISVKMC